MQILLNRYQLKDGSGLVNYREFVNYLDTVFTAEVNPTEVIQGAKTTAVSYKNRKSLTPKFKLQVFTDEEKGKMIDMMTALNRHVVSNRILLKPGFMDFDRSKSQHITAQRRQLHAPLLAKRLSPFERGQMMSRTMHDAS